MATPVFSAKAIGEVGGAVEFASAHVNVALAGFAERDDAGIEAMDECAERDEIERALFGGGNVQTVAHIVEFP